MFILSDPVSKVFSEKDREQLIQILHELADLKDPDIRIHGISEIDKVPNVNIATAIGNVAMKLHGQVNALLSMADTLEQKNAKLNQELSDLNEKIKCLTVNPLKLTTEFNNGLSSFFSYCVEETTPDGTLLLHFGSKNMAKSAISDAIFSFNSTLLS